MSPFIHPHVSLKLYNFRFSVECKTRSVFVLALVSQTILDPMNCEMLRDIASIKEEYALWWILKSGWWTWPSGFVHVVSSAAVNITKGGLIMKRNVIYSTFYSKCYANLYKNVKASGFRCFDSIRLKQ